MIVSQKLYIRNPMSWSDLHLLEYLCFKYQAISWLLLGRIKYLNISCEVPEELLFISEILTATKLMFILLDTKKVSHLRSFNIYIYICTCYYDYDYYY